jgi:hypothetical protein
MAENKLQEPVKSNKTKACACGKCGEMAGPQSFYVKTPDGKFFATRSCYERYKELNKTVYAAPNLAT